LWTEKTPVEIDRAHLDAQTFGDADLARELLALFAVQCARLAPLAADEAAPVQARRDAAHTLKGAALGIGARRLATCAAALEAVLAVDAPEPAAVAAQARAFVEAASAAGSEAAAGPPATEG
jgi:HPt (histidine-containing phosphotransfer) domain-containing protein